MTDTFQASDPSGACLRHNSNGLPYEDFSCLYPTLAKTYFNFEKNFDPVPVRDWMRDHPEVPIISVLIYLTLIPIGRRYFANREPVKWRMVLAAWNLLLCTFSAWGTIRSIPPIIHNLYSFGFRDFMCMDPEVSYASSGTTGLWMLLFSLSKIPELLDTMFIVVHKKHLMLLHWFHHFTTLLGCWYSYVNNDANGIYSAFMNYGVHSFMYGYYFLMCFKVKGINPMGITIAQISQFFVGLGLVFMSIYFYLSKPEGTPCAIKPANIFTHVSLYVAYTILFTQFFFRKYKVSAKTKTV